jgi:hypothetical protein
MQPARIERRAQRLAGAPAGGSGRSPRPACAAAAARPAGPRHRRATGCGRCRGCRCLEQRRHARIVAVAVRLPSHCSSTSAPLRAVNLKRVAAIRAWSRTVEKVSRERCPQRSTISTAASCLPRNPMLIDWKPPSLAFGVAFAHSRPSRPPAAAEVKSRSRESPPASKRRRRRTQRLVEGRTVTWFRSTSCIQTLLAVGDDQPARRAWCSRSGSGRAARTRSCRSRSSSCEPSGERDGLREGRRGRSLDVLHEDAQRSTASAAGRQRCGEPPARGPAMQAARQPRIVIRSRWDDDVAVAVGGHRTPARTSPSARAAAPRGCSRCAGAAAPARSTALVLQHHGHRLVVHRVGFAVDPAAAVALQAAVAVSPSSTPPSRMPSM